ncbi:G-protein coupled receptor family C group 6 member A-like [Menidia menidia]
MAGKWVLAGLCLMGCLEHAVAGCSEPASEFVKKGDYVIGGLFDIHRVINVSKSDRPDITTCSSQKLILSSYRRFQLMRFAVEEINNSTSLLPNVSLGYDTFDHCSDTHNLPGIFHLMSVNGTIQPREESLGVSKVIAVVGIYTSTATLAVAPLFMPGLIPMVSYGAASSVFSRKQDFPSFLRTVIPNNNVIELVFKILQHFNWRWVAFLYIDDDYGNDAQDKFIKKIEDTDICLAYTKGLDTDTNYFRMFRQIKLLKVNVIIVFAPEWTAEALIHSAIRQSVTNKVWIAGDAWSLHKKLPKEEGIRNIGTVLGVAEPKMTIPGFSDFIYSSKANAHCEHAEQETFCNQICNCSAVTAADIITADPSFSFPVYSAVYAIAHALHAVLQCEAGKCNNHIAVYPHMVLRELRRSNFTLLNNTVQFDESGDPKFGSYSIIFWNRNGDPEKVGSYDFFPPFRFVIDKKIQWHGDGSVPASICSRECSAGYSKQQEGVHKCCFNCTICPKGTYINSTEDPYRCIPCQDTEWAAEGSTSCSLRLVEYVPFSDTSAVVILAGACVLVGLILAVSVLFTVHYNTPVVKSAGGPMCFLILGSLFLSNISVFFYFDKPTAASCVLRFLPFLLFFTVSIACFVVRAFQIFYIFKISAKFPKLHNLWIKYQGQWLLIAVAFLIQAVSLTISYSTAPPKPFSHSSWYDDKIILSCKYSPRAMGVSFFLLISLCCLCFVLSYMGKNLPKNYNEAKAITFCLFLLILIWIIFATLQFIYRRRYIESLNAAAVLCSVYSFMGWYFLPKCFIIIFQPQKNTQQYFQSLIQSYNNTSSHQRLILSSYRRFQLMRFTVEEINNSPSLLPNVSLGYNIFDHCSDTRNFPGIFNLMSVRGFIHPWDESPSLKNSSRVVALVGTYTSTETLTVAPLLMPDLIPMVSYGAASSVLSTKHNFPSFFRTVHPNKDVIEVVFKILQHFHWHWVSFLYSDGDYGEDGQDLFRKKIKGTDICLAYTKGLDRKTDYPQMFRQIDLLNVNVIIVFAPEWTAEYLIHSAIRLNFTNKVWIAGDAWSLHKKLPKEEGIRNIGTVLGVAEPKMTIPGFSDFIYSSKANADCEGAEQETFCNQICNCSAVTAADIITADPSFSFPVYSAVYAIAHALHAVLQCGAGKCNNHIAVYPHMVLTELRRSNFTLLNNSVQFDENGDPKSGSYSIVFWNNSGDAEEVGLYHFHPLFQFVINSTKIQWHDNGEVPTSFCSEECSAGYSKQQEGIHTCCFKCRICSNGTYINSTEDPYRCIPCKETEWSVDGSTSCSLRLVEYVPFSDTSAVVILAGACVLVGLILAVSVLFTVHYNTPVVKSAGGPMCFLILGCLFLCTLSVFFYFGVPTDSACILRFLPFLLFYTVCLACFVVRSFQIVCIFKIAAKFPKLLNLWMKYHGQWLLISVAFLIQVVLLTIGYSTAPPKPYNDTFWYADRIILGCDLSLQGTSGPLVLLSTLCCLCFIFSYMGKDLPKNYNEAKAITFCLFLLILSWIILATVSILYHGKYIHTFNALAVLSSLYSFLLWYFLPKCYIILFQPHKNTQQHFQGLIQDYTKTFSQ